MRLLTVNDFAFSETVQELLPLNAQAADDSGQGLGRWDDFHTSPGILVKEFAHDITPAKLQCGQGWCGKNDTNQAKDLGRNQVQMLDEENFSA